MIQTHLTTPYCSIFVLLEACSVALDDSWLRIILIYPTLYFGWAPHFMLCLEQAVLGPGRFLIGCSSWAEGFHSWWARFLCLLFMTSNRAKSRTPPLPRKARGFFLFGAFWLEMMTSLFDICAHFILTLTAVGLDNLTFPLGYVYLVRTRQGVLVQLIRLLDHSSMKTPPLYYGGDSLVGWPSSGRSRQLRTQSTLRQPRSWCWTFKAQTSCTSNIKHPVLLLHSVSVTQCVSDTDCVAHTRLFLFLNHISSILYSVYFFYCYRLSCIYLFWTVQFASVILWIS